MVKLRCVVIDDEPLNREELKYLLSLHPDVDVLGEAGDSNAGWQLVENCAPNLIFLDIRMDRERAGLDLGRKLGRLPRPPRLIFVTAYPEHALDAFDCGPDHFLVKPLNDSKLAEALERVREILAKDPRPRSRIPLPYGERDQFGEVHKSIAYVFASEILLIKTSKDANDSVQVFLDGRIIRDVRRTLGELENTLSSFGFFRPHKSFLVNLRHVIALKPRPGEDLHKIVLDRSTEEIPVARERLQALKSALENPLHEQE